MRLAWRELIRRPGRFVTAGGALTLIVVLLLVLGGILDALIASSTGVLRAQSAPLIAFSRESRDSLNRSRISAEQLDAIAGTTGVATATGFGVALLPAYVPGSAEPADVALFGYEAANLRVPSPPAAGQALADRSLEHDGVAVGQRLELGSARTPVEVVGWVEGTDYNLQGGLWVEPATWREAVAANIPDAAVPDGGFQVVLVDPDDGVAPATVVAGVEGSVEGVTVLTIDEAIAAIPGVAQQQSVFGAIIGVTFIVAGIVVALFFALLTIERLGLLGVLKAIGASSRTLAAGLTLQAVLIAAGAVLLGVLLTLLLAGAIPDAVPIQVGAGRVAFTAVGIIATATIGSALSFRRIIRIDPATAVGSA
ncbi:MAG: ABC transporter permease [Actinomycetota bacterium]